jgi:hypothetical protein
LREFIAGDEWELLNEPIVKITMCASLLIAAGFYYLMNHKRGRVFFGFIQIAAASVSNWYQFGKLAADRGTMYDRTVFLGAGIALLAHGIKDIAKGMEEIKQSEKILSEPDKTPDRTSQESKAQDTLPVQGENVQRRRKAASRR